MKLRIALVMLLSVSVAGLLPAHAEKLVLEAQPRISAAAENPCDIFYECSLWHEVYPDYCTVWHVIYCGPIESSANASMVGGGSPFERRFVGRQLVLENQTGTRNVRIDRVAPQYHLNSGAIVEPTGRWSARDANGEEWSDVRSSVESRRGVANWEDTNRDGIVGVQDQVIFDDGTMSTIKAVRLGVHVSDSNQQ